MTPPQAPDTGLRARVVALVSAAVLALTVGVLAKFEGDYSTPYRDPIGVLTVCRGHTGPDVIKGKRYSPAECDELERQDIAEANATVKRCIPRAMPAHVEAALTSGVFNIGPKLVCGSTLQRKALAGDWAGACAELSRWDKAGGRVLRGLTKRRAHERAMCEGRLT